MEVAVLGTEHQHLFVVGILQLHGVSKSSGLKFNYDLTTTLPMYTPKKFKLTGFTKYTTWFCIK